MSLIPALLSASNNNIDYEYFEEDIPYPERLQAELQTWTIFWETQLVKPSGIGESLKACCKAQYPNIHRILKIAACFHVTSCECERSISRLGEIKTVKRARMGEKRLNGLAQISMHRGNLPSKQDIIRRFISLHARRLEMSNILT